MASDLTPEVTQADREAAADQFAHLGTAMPSMRRGEMDDNSLVQAFAKHRIAALSPVPASAYQAMREALEYIRDYQVGGHESYPEAYEHLQTCAREGLTKSPPQETQHKPGCSLSDIPYRFASCGCAHAPQETVEAIIERCAKVADSFATKARGREPESVYDSALYSAGMNVAKAIRSLKLEQLTPTQEREG